MPAPSHSVLFYERDDILVDALTAFAAEGLDAGERVIAIATPQHIASLVSALGSRPEPHPPQNNLVLLYAADTLRRIAPDGDFEPQRLFDWLGPMVDAGPCRVFGEMVSLLAERGRLDAAFEVEAAGDELAHQKHARVLCGYDLRHLAGAPLDDAVARIAAGHGTVVEAPAPGPLRPGTKTRRARVVLAEDFQDAREVYAEYLQYADFEVVTAVDGQDAVARARECLPDVVLLDIRMPNLTGTQAMQLLREDERFRRVPFVALTALTFDNDRASLLAAGFDAVIEKPCLPDRLVKEILLRLQRPEPA
jgi:CheY-like chemotaxis protein